MQASDVSLLRNKCNGYFSWHTVWGGSWDGDAVESGSLLGTIPFWESRELAWVEVLPSFYDFGSCWLGEDYGLSSTFWQLFEGCLVAMVAFILADDHNIRFGDIAQRGDTGVCLLLRYRELGMDDA